MGTTSGCRDGIVPKVLEKLFADPTTTMRFNFKLRVSEIFGNEISDLLEPNSMVTTRKNTPMESYCIRKRHYKPYGEDYVW